MKTTERLCRNHGLTIFVMRSDGYYRCMKCASEAVIRRTQKKKKELVEYFGGKCIKCGYNRCISALQFHHRIPEHKSFGVSAGHNYSFERMVAEAKKCDLVCANCHFEIEYEYALVT